MPILLSNTRFKTKVRRVGEGHHIRITSSTHEDEVSILGIHTHNASALTRVNETLLEVKLLIIPYTSMAENISITH